MNLFGKVTQKVIKTSDITVHFDEFIKEIDGIILESDLELSNIEKENAKLLERVNTLKSLGFTSAKSVTESTVLQENVENKKKQIKSIKESKEYIDKYVLMFPGYKFVPEEIFISILKKYNIYDGSSEYYIGDIPDQNIKAIKNFKDNFNNIYLLIEDAGRFYGYGYDDNEVKIIDIGKMDFLNKQNHWSINNIFTRSLCSTIRISAPLSDFKLSEKLIINHEKNSISLKNIKVDDPIVNIKVPGGRIIITAWDKEALDPEILNAESN